MEKDSSQFFRELKDKITDYADLKLEYYKLSSYEIVGKAAGKLSYGLILIIAGLWTVLFLLLASGFFLGDLLNSYGLGFLCVALILLVIIGVILVCKDWIRTQIINKCLKGISTLEQELENGDDTNRDTDTIITTDTAGEIMLPEEGTQNAE